MNQQRSQRANVFYPLVVVSGVLFLLTTCAFAIVTAQGFGGPQSMSGMEDSSHRLSTWMDRYGFHALLVELAVLALATVAAITTDEVRRHRGVSASGGEGNEQ